MQFSCFVVADFGANMKGSFKFSSFVYLLNFTFMMLCSFKLSANVRYTNFTTKSQRK